MAAPLLLDLTHTSHTRARTGIQRVARALRAALGAAAEPITFDPYLRGWRTLQPWERANLEPGAPAAKRGARWPLAARVRSTARRLLHRGARMPAHGAGLVVPEVFSPAVAAALPELFAATTGPRVAVFHDAIALKLPELTPAKTVARFPAYLRELLAFDAIAAISEDSRESLLAYWRWLGVTNAPPVRTIPLGIDRASGFADAAGHKPANRRGSAPPPYSPDTSQPCRAGSPNPAVPVVLCIGSIEGRKNHLTLLDACEALWARGLRYELHLIGLAHPETGRVALERLRALQAGGRPLRYDGPATDAAVDQAYAACAFTVYPSLMEGFGLPVLESLTHGKACICSSRGAVGESARGGGCLGLEQVDRSSLAAALERLLTCPTELARLTDEAQARTFRTWADYATELTAWLEEVRRPDAGGLEARG